MMQGRFSDARKAAEQLVAHIEPHVKNTPMLERSLLGLQESLETQGKSDAVRLVQQEFEAAWRRADTKVGAVP